MKSEKKNRERGNVVKVFLLCEQGVKEREGKVGKDEKYIINQSDSLILILLVFLDGI
jgi:hypothetical protein